MGLFLQSDGFCHQLVDMFAIKQKAKQKRDWNGLSEIGALPFSYDGSVSYRKTEKYVEFTGF